MKKIIFILFLFAAFQNVKAQSVDTIKSVALGDTIVIQHCGIEIQPIIANIKGDTARSIYYYAFSVQADSTQSCMTYITFYDKNGNNLPNAAFNQSIPAGIINQWKSDPLPVYNYILLMNPQFKRP